MEVKVVFDIDDVIAMGFNHTKHDEKVVNSLVVDKMKSIKSELNAKIVLHTSRGSVSCNGDLQLIEKNILPNLVEWLKVNDVPYDEIVFGKPLADLYVDDKGMNLRTLVSSEFKEINTGGSGKKVYLVGDTIVKEMDKESAERLQSWYVDNQKYNVFKTPTIKSFNYGKVYIEYVNGVNLYDDLYMSDLFTLLDVVDKCEQIKFSSFDLSRHFDALKKNKGFDSYIDSCINKCELLLERELSLVPNIATFCHGDFTLSNTIKDAMGNLQFIDCNYDKLASSYLLDLAKLRMSLCGYEKNFEMTSNDFNKHLEAFDWCVEDKKYNLNLVKVFQFMYTLRLYRYKGEDGKKVVKKMVEEFRQNNEELFARG